MRAARPGSWGYLALALWSVATATLLPAARLPALLALLVLLGAWVHPAGLHLLRDGRVWLLAGIALAIGAFWLGERDATAWGVRYSAAGLRQGALMGTRALALLLGLSVSAAALSVSGWTRVLAALGAPGLGFALGVAFNLLPTLGRLSESAYQSIRLRSGWRRPRHAARLYVVTITTNALGYGDEVVRAAASRAFDPATAPHAPVPWRAGDGWLLGALLAASLALWLL